MYCQIDWYLHSLANASVIWSNTGMQKWYGRPYCPIDSCTMHNGGLFKFCILYGVCKDFEFTFSMVHAWYMQRLEFTFPKVWQNSMQSHLEMDNLYWISTLCMFRRFCYFRAISKMDVMQVPTFTINRLGLNTHIVFRLQEKMHMTKKNVFK